MTAGQRLWLYATVATCDGCTLNDGAITLCLHHSAEWNARDAWTPGLPNISAVKVAEARWGDAKMIPGGEE